MDYHWHEFGEGMGAGFSLVLFWIYCMFSKFYMIDARDGGNVSVPYRILKYVQISFEFHQLGEYTKYNIVQM